MPLRLIPPRAPSVPGRRPAWVLRLRRHRRVLAAVLAGSAVWAVASAAHPPTVPARAVLVAAHDLAPGTVLVAADVRTASLPAGAVPSDAVASPATALARTVTAPVLAGEAVRSRDLLAPSLVAALGPGMRATPVRLADDVAASLLRPGDGVDVLAAVGGDGATGGSASAEVVAAGVRVLAVPDAASSAAGGLLGGGSSTGAGVVLVLATTPQQALDLARAAAVGRLSVTLRPD